MTGASGGPLAGLRAVEPGGISGHQAPGDPDRDLALRNRRSIAPDVNTPDGRSYGGTTEIVEGIVGQGSGL